jgi:hypothetical protein
LEFRGGLAAATGGILIGPQAAVFLA